MTLPIINSLHPQEDAELLFCDELLSLEELERGADEEDLRSVEHITAEERRRELIKGVKKTGEDTKVAIRNIRRDGVDHFKKAQKASEIT